MTGAGLPGGAEDQRVRREEAWQTLCSERFDVLVIGGGITGAGVAWEAARAGWKTALVEERDWAFGTSSRSSKLIHGGLRYLPRGEVRLVRAVGREREALERLAPHLVRPLPFLIPVYRGMGLPLPLVGMGVWFYDHLTGVPPARRRHLLSAAALREEEPALAAQGLAGGVSYWEARTDDARLVWSVVRAAQEAGAVALSRTRAAAVSLGAAAGGAVELEELEGGRRGAARARAVVNATGPWASALDPGGPPLALGRGIHLVFRRERLPLRYAVNLPTLDGANVFAVPRGEVAYVGTTDRLYQGDPAEPDAPCDDARYLLEILARVFPGLGLEGRDVLAVFSGVRPLIARQGTEATAELSRRDEVDVRRDGLISVRGGKLTGFRTMARAVLRELSQRLGPPPAGLGTDTPLPGAADDEDLAQAPERIARQRGLPLPLAAALVARYGGEAEEVVESAAARHRGLESVLGQAPLLFGEVDWAVEREEALHLSDVLIRRTGFAWFSGLSDVGPALPAVAGRMAELLGWDEATTAREVEACRREAHLGALAAIRGACTAAGEGAGA